MPSNPTSPKQPPGIPVDELIRSFPEKAVDHMLRPRNVGEFQMPDGLGRASNECGDSMQICLRVSQGRILEVRFMTNGCGPVIACGSMATELVKGKSTTEAMLLSEDDIMTGLGGLPDSETHCATLAVTALRWALTDYLALRREPWKRPYRRVGPFEPGG